MINEEFKYHGKNINLELAGKFAYTTYELEKRIANSAASAARSATQLKNTADKFVEVLNPEQLLALKAAASVVSRLAFDLQALRPWAKAYAQYMEEVRLRQREEELAARERERWPTDQAAVDEASDLIVFLDSGAVRR
ncbi:hypothetical protein ACPWT1_02805 [Ramlibacter sp. MMS24-I3-19]|uniref:hypothetical protein n=1 Tax=Ramlibacter sp. MMS24-I3-19 TaxID=3416606 RepID=UPI003D03CC73